MHTGIPFDIRRAAYLRSSPMVDLQWMRAMHEHSLDDVPTYPELAMEERIALAEVNAEIARRILRYRHIEE